MPTMAGKKLKKKRFFAGFEKGKDFEFVIFTLVLKSVKNDVVQYKSGRPELNIKRDMNF